MIHMNMVDVTATQLEYIRAVVAHPDPVVTSSEISDVREVTQQAAHHALDGLVDLGLIEKKQVGARSVVFWSTPEARQLARSDR